MGQVKKTKKVVPEEAIETEKIVNPKRVAIASVICVIITGLIMWSLAQVAEKISDMGTSDQTAQATAPANVRLPQKGDAAYVMHAVKKNVHDFSLDDYTATGSAARSVLETLQNLQKSEFGIEDYFCQIFCN